MTQTDLGTDLGVLSDGDLDPLFSLASGPSLVATDVARRLQTSALFYASIGDYGLDVRALVGSRLGAVSIGARLGREASRDERVLDASVSVDGTQITLVGTTASGPFAFVVDAAGAPGALAAGDTP